MLCNDSLIMIVGIIWLEKIPIGIAARSLLTSAQLIAKKLAVSSLYSFFGLHWLRMQRAKLCENLHAGGEFECDQIINGRYRARDTSGIYIYMCVCVLLFRVFTLYRSIQYIQNMYIYICIYMCIYMYIYMFPGPPSTSPFHMLTGICICTMLDEVWSLDLEHV